MMTAPLGTPACCGSNGRSAIETTREKLCRRRSRKVALRIVHVLADDTQSSERGTKIAAQKLS
jgi:hypothetical protein